MNQGTLTQNSFKRGDKSTGTQAIVSHTELAADAVLLRIFISINTPALSKSSMQSTANKVNKSIIKISKNFKTHVVMTN